MFSLDTSQAFAYRKLDVRLSCHPSPGFECAPGTVIGLSYCICGTKLVPAYIKGISVEFMLPASLR